MEELNIEEVKNIASEAYKAGTREGARIATEALQTAQDEEAAARDARAEALNRYNALMAKGQGAEATFIYLNTLHGGEAPR